MLERNQLYEIVDTMSDCFRDGAKGLLEDVIRYMSSDELEGCLRYIDRCWDFGIFEEVDGSTEDEEEDENG